MKNKNIHTIRVQRTVTSIDDTSGTKNITANKDKFIKKKKKVKTKHTK